MPRATLHIVFSDSFSGSLRVALRELGRDDAIACFLDDLSFGPIDPPDPRARRKWVRRELAPGMRDREWPLRPLAAFWKAALAPSSRRIVWVSTRSAPEFAGFLEFVWRLGEGSCDLVAFDGDALVSRGDSGHKAGGRAIALAELPPYHLTATRYWERAAPLERAERERYRSDWARLRAENAPLRILDESGLVSAPITHFDELLMSCTVGQWRKAARVIGEALSTFWDGPFHQVGDVVLAARVRALAEAGRLESQGNLRRVRFSEVRLPGSEDAPPPIT
jgi:hypothetical protein